MRALAVVAVLVVLTQGAAAASTFSSRALTVDGASTLQGTSHALFALASPETPYSWTLTADEAVIVRTYIPWQAVISPTGEVLFEKIDDADKRTERLVFTRPALRSEGLQRLSGLLATGEGARLDALGTGHLALAPVRDHVFHQGPPPEFEGDQMGALPLLEIHQTVPGEHLLASVGDSSWALEGDLSVVLVGPSYQLDAAEGPFAGRTGFYETQRVLVHAKGFIERQEMTLTNARLVLDSAAEVQTLTPAARLLFQGTLSAVDPIGSFPLQTPTVGGGAWSGQGALDLAPEADRVTMRAADPLQAAGTSSVPVPFTLFPYALGAVGLVAVAAGGAVLFRRRRADEDDPLSLALLAMEDRRFADALPHVERALLRAPHDAKLLVDRALCLEETGRLRDARDGYEAALRAEPFNAETHYYYARTLARLRNPTGALAHLTRALSLDARLTELARRESAFSVFRDHPQFLGMLE